jgi:guanylate kinase
LNNLLVISGPSGAGKSTLICRLLARHSELKFSVSHTTRAPRGGERDGVEYHFVTPERFKAMQANNEFAEWAEVHGNFYGTSLYEVSSKSQQPDTLLLDIDVQGAQLIKTMFSEAVMVFLLPPTPAELKRRLQGRERQWSESMENRLRVARMELKQAYMYDYIVINDNLDATLEALDSIYTAFRHMTARCHDVVLEWLGGEA